MIRIRHKGLLAGVAIATSAFIQFGCGSTAPTVTGITASAPSGVIGKVDSGVQGTGSATGRTPLGANAIAKSNQKLPGILNSFFSSAFASGGGVDSVCDSHGQPLGSPGQDYPAYVFFCKIAKNTGDPDSIQGSYQMVRSISCMLERAGLVFDGASHTVVATPDTNCFTTDQLTKMGVSGPMTVSVVASRPAAFNTYFDAGIVMTVAGFGTFTVGAKVAGSKVEFIAYEDQTAIAANKTGVYAASFDSSTGDLRFEARHDRFGCSQSGSCGWSRHDRIYAKLILDASGNVTGVQTISGVHSGLNNNGSGNYSSEVDTLTGDFSTGVKARNFSYSGSTQANTYSGTALTSGEGVNTRCYTNTTSAASCSSNPGIAVPTSGTVPFIMHPSTTYTSTSSWLAAYAGMNFTTVTVTDVQ